MVEFRTETSTRYENGKKIVTTKRIPIREEKVKIVSIAGRKPQVTERTIAGQKANPHYTREGVIPVHSRSGRLTGFKVEQEPETVTPPTAPRGESITPEAQAMLRPKQTQQTHILSSTLNRSTPVSVDGDVQTSTLAVYQRPVRHAPIYRTVKKDYDSEGKLLSVTKRLKAEKESLIDVSTGKIIPGGTIVKEEKVFFPSKQTVPQREYSVREEGNYFQEFQRRLTSIARSDSDKGWYKDFSGTSKSSGASLLLVGSQASKTIVYDIPVGLIHIVKHPIKSAKSFFSIVTKPTETISKIATYSKINPELIVGTGLGIVASGGVFGYTKSKFIDPVVAKGKTVILPSYKSVGDTGIKFVPAHTVNVPKSTLLKLETQKVTSIHVTIAKLPDEFVTLAKPSSAGSFRSQYNLYHFYKSAPSQGKPQAYLGYAGIFDDLTSVPAEYVKSWRKPKIKALVFSDDVTHTPSFVKAKDIQTINLWQGQQSGKTFVPAENIKGFSVESQLITPSKYADEFGKPLVGFESFKGSVIKRTGKSTYTYFVQNVKNPYSNIIAKKIWDVTGVKKKYHKIELIPAKTSPVISVGGVDSTASLIESGARLDITPSYYTPKQYGTVSYTPSISAVAVSSSFGISSKPKILSASFPIEKSTGFSRDYSIIKKSSYLKSPIVSSASKSLIISISGSGSSGGSGSGGFRVPSVPKYSSGGSGSGGFRVPSVPKYSSAKSSISRYTAPPPYSTPPPFVHVKSRKSEFVFVVQKKKKKKKKGKYKPTFFTASQGIKGKSSKFGTISGLGIRPVKVGGL